MGGGRERAATRSAGESLPHIIITNNQWEQDREMLFMSSAPKKKKKKTIVAYANAYFLQASQRVLCLL